MISVLILCFIAGVLFANGAPYFLKGITGERHQTPFGKLGTAAESVVWGWLNFVVGVLIWHIAPTQSHPRATFVAVSAGVLLTGVMLAGNWARRGKKSEA